MRTIPKPGQRWVSEAEPELGLGRIVDVSGGLVRLEFRAAHEQRRYALDSAPLRRVKFRTGDRIQLASGTEHRVLTASESRGLISYQCEHATACETELADAMTFSSPLDRLLSGHVDDDDTFTLRAEALFRRGAIRKSPVRGFAGARVSLLPHQLFIAAEVAGRLLPRVLLADEVGLGKTIEAGLILMRLHLTGRASRILILVPEPLVHQWFVEMLRRFQMTFSIFDEERCAAIDKGDPSVNPFLDSQLVLCSLSVLTENPDRTTQAAAAGWDLLVVDEAHHLAWTNGEVSPEYAAVERLATATPGVLLLTATPHQLGMEGHFARLRLLDPQRYPSLEAFLADSAHDEELAKAVDRVKAGRSLTKSERQRFLRSDRMTGNGSGAALVEVLLDSFGPGRVLFRNARSQLGGFPQRLPTLYPLEEHPDGDFAAKLGWLADLLQRLGKQKVLLICRTQELASQIHETLPQVLNLPAALFHEGMALLQRDRAAAWFAEEDGARILICSEIGSEGRNFQFARNLVLFDLPEDPEVLEQRIGRLDRIGQRSAVHLHIPFVRNTADETLARWYHEGLDAFSHCLHGASEITAAVRPLLTRTLGEIHPQAVQKLVSETKRQRQNVERRLARGQDRLLAMNSCRPAKAAAIIREIETLDADAAFQRFVLRMLDHAGMVMEEHSERSWLLHPGSLLAEALPSVSHDGMTMTFDRRVALAREDMAFLTQDHPLVRGAMDLLLGSAEGNASFSLWPDAPHQGLLLEAYFVLECVAPPALHADRFLPALPLRVVVEQSLQEAGNASALLRARLEPGDLHSLLRNADLRQKRLPGMLQQATVLAEKRAATARRKAASAMTSALTAEIARLGDLALVNDHIRPEETSHLEAQRTELGAVISAAPLRLDALRLILSGAP